MIVQARICDVCQSEVDDHWPLHLSGNKESNPTGKHLSADFCSVACLKNYLTGEVWA